jgi:protein MBA1
MSLIYRSVAFHSRVGVRALSSSRIVANESKKAKNSAPQQQVFDPRFIGLTRDIYVPVAYKNLPNPITSPRAVWRSLIRRLYTLGMNTVQVALMRYQTGIKPQFLLWKNRAIENYVATNKAFAAGDIKSIEKDVSVWVEKALKARVGSIPKDVKLDWKLVKFNEKPTLVAFRPIMLPGRPVEFAQVVYKFNTQQELINVNLKTDKVKKVHRNVTDYVGFVIDLDTDQVVLAGTVFENTPDDRIPKPEDIDQSMIFDDMKINGDIYRAPPQLKAPESQ